MNVYKQKRELADRLARLGISFDDALSLRRIEMTLHRWAEGECGDANGTCIERDESTGKPYRTYECGMNGARGHVQIADREAGALKRLNAVMTRYPQLLAYHQTDPRGCALYLIPRARLTDETDVSSIYSSYGMGVCS